MQTQAFKASPSDYISCFSEAVLLTRMFKFSFVFLTYAALYKNSS